MKINNTKIKVLLLLLTIMYTTLHANTTETFTNKWRNTTLNVGNNTEWIVKKHSSYNGYTICRKSNQNYCLNIENGSLRSSFIQSGWLSAVWNFPSAGSGYVYIQNAWKTDQYINVENSSTPQISTIIEGWFSAMWKRTTVNTEPIINSVTPTKPVLYQQTTFNVNGSNLPDDLRIWIDECTGMQVLGGTSTSKSFRCTPNYKAGIHQGEVYDKAGDDKKVLKTFTINFKDLSDKVNPTGSITSTINSSYELGKGITFGIKANDNEKLKSITLNVSKSTNQTPIASVSQSWSSTSTSFNQIYTLDTKLLGIGEYNYALWVKDDADNTLVVKEGTFSVVLPQPIINSITPTNPVLNQQTTFNVEGSNLPDDLRIWIDECTGMQVLGGTSTNKSFRCTPSYKAGTHQGEVYDKAGDDKKVLKTFTINFKDLSDNVNPTGSITSIINSSYELGKGITFGIKANDNEKLKSITLNVSKSTNQTPIASVSQSWSSTSTSFNQIYTLDTKLLGIGEYNYALWVKDDADNTLVVKEGTFSVTLDLVVPPPTEDTELSKTLGVRYEQPICFNTTAPTVSIEILKESEVTHNGIQSLAIEMEADVRGGSQSCTDSRNIFHTQHIFMTWKTDKGGFMDITENSSEVEYNRVKFIIPVTEKYEYQIRLYVGDNLGKEVRKSITESNGKDTDGDGTADVYDWDDDNDGLTDYQESKYSFLNPLVADAQSDYDSDGISNIDEINEYRTDPSKKDTDGDGVDDNKDDYPLDATQYSKDADNFSVSIPVQSSGYVNEEIIFSLALHGISDQENVTYKWTFGDGNSSTNGNTVTHIFEKEGIYEVEVIASYKGKSITSTISVTVTTQPLMLLPSPFNNVIEVYKPLNTNIPNNAEHYGLRSFNRIEKIVTDESNVVHMVVASVAQFMISNESFINTNYYYITYDYNTKQLSSAKEIIISNQDNKIFFKDFVLLNNQPFVLFGKLYNSSEFYLSYKQGDSFTELENILNKSTIKWNKVNFAEHNNKLYIKWVDTENGTTSIYRQNKFKEVYPKLGAEKQIYSSYLGGDVRVNNDHLYALCGKIYSLESDLTIKSLLSEQAENCYESEGEFKDYSSSHDVIDFLETSDGFIKLIQNNTETVLLNDKKRLSEVAIYDDRIITVGSENDQNKLTIYTNSNQKISELSFGKYTEFEDVYAKSDMNKNQIIAITNLERYKAYLTIADLSSIAVTPPVIDTDNDGITDDKDLDDDNDGISDVDEVKYGFNPLNASDATQDADGDGTNNIDEITAGTNPNDKNDYPSIMVKPKALDFFSVPLYTINNIIALHIVGYEAGVLVVNGEETDISLVEGIQRVELDADEEEYSLQVKVGEFLSDIVSFKLYQNLNITLEEEMLSLKAVYGENTGKYVRYYRFDLDTEKTLTIDMLADFDTHLSIVDMQLKPLYQDNDGGDGTNSRLENITLVAGSYYIEVTTVQVDVSGQFSLIIKEVTDTDNDGISDDKDFDDDNDGISDEDEMKYGLNPLDASDATQDTDGDGTSNIDEINVGTNPRDKNDGSISGLSQKEKAMFMILLNRSNQLNRDNVEKSWQNSNTYINIPTLLMIEAMKNKKELEMEEK